MNTARAGTGAPANLMTSAAYRESLLALAAGVRFSFSSTTAQGRLLSIVLNG